MGNKSNHRRPSAKKTYRRKQKHLIEVVRKRNQLENNSENIPSHAPSESTQEIKIVTLSNVEPVILAENMADMSSFDMFRNVLENKEQEEFSCGTNPVDEDSTNVENHSLVIETEDNDEFRVKGRRIVDINYLMEQLQTKGRHNDLFNCTLQSFKLIGEKRKGLRSKFKLECSLCKTIVIIDSENPENDNDLCVNLAATSGIIASGTGFHQFEEILSAIDIPVFSPKLYAQLQDIVYQKWEETATETMIESAIREREAALAEGRLKNGVPLVDVFVDGAWGSRSYGNNYKALSGTAAIIGKHTGEVLYMGVKNKYCYVCAVAQKKNSSPKEHVCFKNYCGSSSAMEADIITEGFKSSVEMHGIIYARMVADGDSSTYNKILEANPYDQYNHTVEKLECRNHILRNFCNKLRATLKETKYLIKDRKTLTTEKILGMRKFIVKSIKFHKQSTEAKPESIRSLHKDITNSIAHAYGDHSTCKDYHCSKNNTDTTNTIHEIRNSAFLFRIKAIVCTTASKARSLIEDVDTNLVECFNGVVAKFVGGKRINYSQKRGYQARCSAAVVSFNTQRAISSVQKSILGKSPTGRVKEIERKRTLKRKWNKDHPTKKIRKTGNYKQHNYGPTCSAPDMSAEQFELAKEDFLKNLKDMTSNKDIIERRTVLQKDCSEWIEIRKNLITASNFGPICKRKLSTSSANSVKNLLYKKNLAHVSSVAHGIENEKVAIQQMEKQLNITIEPCGLFIDSEHPFIGATPDGLVANDTIIEVKCPVVAFKKGIDEALRENKIQLYKFDKKKILRL